MTHESYLTVSQAAVRLQVGPETIRRMLRDGRLVGVRLGGTRAGWRIASSDVERLLEPSVRPVAGPAPRRLKVAPPALVSDALTHALAEAKWARDEGNLVEARRWEQRAQDLATSSEA